MVEILITLTPISLVDSLSLLPFAVVVLTSLLNGPRPYSASAGFLLGTAVPYFAAGLLIVFGLGGLLQRASEVVVHRFWNPQDIDYALSMLIGIALIVLGYRWANARRERAERREAGARMTPVQAFLLGAGAMIAGLWGALPYFAAVDQLLKANLSAWSVVVALAYYNVVFVSIPALLVLFRAVAEKRADALLESVDRLLKVWGRRLVIAGMILIGLTMLADGIGWLLGHPLIPVDS